MRAGGSARAVTVGTPGPVRAGLWLAAVAAVASFAFALYSGTTTIERIAVVVAAGLGVVAAVGLTAAYQRRRAVRALAASAAEVTAGGPRRLTDDAELRPVTTLINRMADDAARTLATLRGERDLLGSVLDSMTQGVIALDRDLRITLINPAARRIFALPGVPIGERFVDQIAAPEALALVTAARADGAAEFTTAAGVRASARVTPQRSGDGRLLVVDDVTAIRRLETIRADFIANVSHELRTPVAVIRANAEILQSGGKDDPAFAGRLIDGLHRNAERLARIIADLLDLSRLDAGQYRLELAAVGLDGAVTQAITAIEAQANARGTTVTTAIAPDLAVAADGKALDQVLVNLLDNAIKYSPAGGQVAVGARRVGDTIRVEVADDGPGIPAVHRDRIFERFYRVDPGRSRDQGGTGLGLSIVKHLIESMGGAVGVTANQPQGSVFFFVLPVADPPSRSVATSSPS